ncbi:MAG: glycosyltransferase [Candidatus Thermoplasmatota archaeon]
MVLVTVVIPTFNNAATVGRTIAAVWPQVDEVLVVDDGSTDATRDIAREQGATVIQVQGRSAGHARNVGWQRARNEIVLFTDSDAVPTPSWAAMLARAFEEPDVLIAGGSVGSLSETRFGRLYHRMYVGLDAANFHDGSVYLPGMNLAVRKSLYERVRFSDALPGAQCEDVDFEMRAAALGIRPRFVPEAVVLHHQPADFGEFVEQELRHGEGRARLVRLHPELKRLWHTDRVWKWFLMSTVGASAHVLYALRRTKRFDVPLLVLHVLRMAIGDHGFLRGTRKLRG